MPEAALQRSPLAKFLIDGRRPGQSTNPGVCLEERIAGYLNLRARATAACVAHIEGFSGVRLPVQPNTFTGNHKTIALWMGPDEWLIVVPSGAEDAVAQRFREAGQERVFAVTDVTHGNTTINISGPQVIETLSKGCSLDLHPSAFRANDCAQTLLAKAAILIRRVDDTPSFDLVVRRSFAEYLALWLQDAGSEYGVEIV